MPFPPSLPNDQEEYAVYFQYLLKLHIEAAGIIYPS